MLEKAEQLAVEFYIPSNYKFIKKFNSDDWNLPFEIGETRNYSGRPRYYS